MQSVLHSVVGPAEPPAVDLSGKTAIVTGGALGIGFEVSRAFALQNCRVIMVNRKEEQGAEAIAKIKTEGKEKGVAVGDVEWVECDLGNLKQTKEVFEGLAKKEERLDFLILSAGINTNQKGFTADGYDRHFQVNALSHFFVINILYSLLRKTSKLPGVKPPRIVFEASEMHRFAPSNVHFGSEFEIQDYDEPTGLYGRTKLAMILYTKQILKTVIKPNNDNIYVLAVHPGAVNTDMQKQWEDAYPGVLGTAIRHVTEFFGRDPEQGSYSALYAALSDEVVEKDYNGYYLSDPGQPGKETSQASDMYLAQALWELSQRMIVKVLGDGVLKEWDQ